MRVPVIMRTPIIDRNPIIDRVPLEGLDEPSNSDICIYRPHCDIGVSCDSYTYTVYRHEQLYSDKMYANVIKYDKNMGDSYICKTIELLSNKGIPVVIITDTVLTGDIIEQLSINPFNSLHVCIPINVINTGGKELLRYHSMMYLAKSYGIYTVLRISPVTPTIMKLFTVGELVNSTRNNCDHISIEFAHFDDVMLLTKRFIEVDGVAVSTNYFARLNNKVVCAHGYVSSFRSIISDLVANVGNTVSFCNGLSHWGCCTGIKYKPYIRDEDGYSSDTNCEFNCEGCNGCLVVVNRD